MQAALPCARLTQHTQSLGLAEGQTRPCAGAVLVDPMCGSGTLLIEGALMAANAAPGLRRAAWPFERWPDHDARAWRAAREGAAAARRAPRAGVRLLGSDAHAGSVSLACRCGHDCVGILFPLRVRQRACCQAACAAAWCTSRRGCALAYGAQTQLMGLCCSASVPSAHTCECWRAGMLTLRASARWWMWAARRAPCGARARGRASSSLTRHGAPACWVGE